MALKRNQSQAYFDGLIDTLQSLNVNRAQALDQPDSIHRADLLWRGRTLIRPSIGFCFKLSRASAAKAPGGLQRGVDQSALGSFPSEAISLSNSPENRFSVRLFLTAIPSAFFCPIRMTSFLPRVMPV